MKRLSHLFVALFLAAIVSPAQNTTTLPHSSSDAYDVIGPAGPGSYFRIEAVDGATGRGVPLVKFTTLNGIAHWTDSAGVIAFHEPGLMGRELWFYVESDGYEGPDGGFGYRGVKLTAEPGGRATVTLRRTMISQRLYRITGAGIYRDTLLLGEAAPIREPLLNAGVIGQDSTLTAVYHGRKFWIWGDTSRANYPLAANFKVTGAVSALPFGMPDDLDPERGVNLNYFMDGETVKQLAPFESPGPVWLSGLLPIADDAGTTRLLARFALIKPPMDTAGRGMAQWNDEKKEFEIVARHDLDDVMQPDGHPLRVNENGVEYFYFQGDSRFHRVRAEYKSILDLTAYESWTCLEEGTRFDPAAPVKSRLSPDGWGWRRNTSAIGSKEQDALIKSGLMYPENYPPEIIEDPNPLKFNKFNSAFAYIPHPWFRLTDPATGGRVSWHGGSIYWNDYRHKWVMIFGEIFGTSVLGEIWYAEADAPLGPWGYAVKVATHTKYSFYNPVQHPDLAKDGGRKIFFEGTYTTTFSGAETPTPRYDYNQIMHMLELDDSRLNLPQPVYFVAGEWPHYRFARDLNGSKGQIVFYAMDRESAKTVPIYERFANEHYSIITSEKSNTDSVRSRVAFHALPLDTKMTTSTALLQVLSPRLDYTISRVYSILDDFNINIALMGHSDYLMKPSEVCVVWRPPVAYNPFASEFNKTGRLMSPR